ncbi:unnamed protein product [Pleuronectes platessa]|uniref:Uncharacterized protein n=1 Tax=Pleuronectes platessa TaxID=8262 RepID=A0A9N7YZ56_PLEPL|nr:unnamed protein product [Pleuronectes platessa]
MESRHVSDPRSSAFLHLEAPSLFTTFPCWRSGGREVVRSWTGDSFLFLSSRPSDDELNSICSVIITTALHVSSA